MSALPHRKSSQKSSLYMLSSLPCLPTHSNQKLLSSFWLIHLFQKQWRVLCSPFSFSLQYSRRLPLKSFLCRLLWHFTFHFPPTSLTALSQAHWLPPLPLSLPDLSWRGTNGGPSSVFLRSTFALFWCDLIESHHVECHLYANDSQICISSCDLSLGHPTAYRTSPLKCLLGIWT